MTMQDATPIEQRLKTAYAARLAGIVEAALRPIPELDAVGSLDDGPTPGAVDSPRGGHRLLMLAAASVVVIASLAIAIATTAGRHHSPAPPGNPSPSPSPTPAPTSMTSTSTSAAPSSPSPTHSGTSSDRASRSSSSTASSPAPITGASRWDGAVLVITGHSLGGVRVGMTAREAAQAAGVPGFVMVGDGVQRPSNAQIGHDPYLYLGNFAGPPASSFGGDFLCVGAQTIGTAAAGQVVTTDRGLRLGDPAARVPAIYGSRAIFVPLPTTGGLSPRAGYVVHEGRYDLIFKLDQHNSRVTGIAGGFAPMNPSQCIG